MQDTAPIELRFTIVITDDDDGGYLAECEELGLVTCADSLDELRTMVESMLRGHLMARSKHGTLAQLIAELHGNQAPIDPIPSLELVMDMKLRQVHSFSP